MADHQLSERASETDRDFFAQSPSSHFAQHLKPSSTKEVFTFSLILLSGGGSLEDTFKCVKLIVLSFPYAKQTQT